MSLILILINICWSLSLLSDTLKAYLVKGFLHLANDIFLLYYQIYHSSYTNCDCEKECQEPKSIGKWYHAYQKEENELNLLIYFPRFVTPQNLNKISITLRLADFFIDRLEFMGPEIRMISCSQEERKISKLNYLSFSIANFVGKNLLICLW